MKRQNRCKERISFLSFTEVRAWPYPSGLLLTWRGRGSSNGPSTRKSILWRKAQAPGFRQYTAVPLAVLLHEVLSHIMAQHSQLGGVTPSLQAGPWTGDKGTSLGGGGLSLLPGGISQKSDSMPHGFSFWRAWLCGCVSGKIHKPWSAHFPEQSLAYRGARPCARPDLGPHNMKDECTGRRRALLEISGTVQIL